MIARSKGLAAVAFALFVLAQSIHADANISGTLNASFDIKMPIIRHNAIDCSLALSKPLIPWEDLYKIQAFADVNDLEIDFFAPNPFSLPYMGREGYKPKPEEVKCKTARSGKYAGLVHCPPNMFPRTGEWRQNVRDLTLKGYTILGPEHDYLVLQDGKAFYADYDFVSVRRYGQNAYSEELRSKLNELLGRRMFRHPPLADYEYRSQIPIKFPIMSFSPRSALLVIYNEDTLATRLHQLGISWPW